MLTRYKGVGIFKVKKMKGYKMSWGERSCKYYCTDCKEKPKSDLDCNMNCQSYKKKIYPNYCPDCGIGFSFEHCCEGLDIKLKQMKGQ